MLTVWSSDVSIVVKIMRRFYKKGEMMKMNFRNIIYVPLTKSEFDKSCEKYRLKATGINPKVALLKVGWLKIYLMFYDEKAATL